MNMYDLTTRLFSHRKWPLYLFFIITLMSQLFTALMNVINSVVWWGRIDLDLILIGCIDSFVVTSLIAPVAIYLIRHSFNLEEVNRSLKWEIDDRIRVEEALKQAEKHFKIVTDNSADVIWMMDTDLRFTYVSPAIEKLTGYPLEEYLTKPHQEIIAPADFNLLMTILAEESEIEKLPEKDLFRARTIEVEEIRKDGSRIWVELRITGIRDADGTPIGLLGFSRDITERKKVENELKASEEKFRFLAEKMSDVIWTVDNNLRLVYVSPSIEGMLGFTVEEHLGRSIDEQVTPASMSIIQGTIARELALEKEGKEDPDRTVTLELEFYHKNGTTRWVEQAVSGIRNERGAVTGFYGVGRDITDRKRTEEILRQSEAKYRLITEKMNDAIWTSDLGLRLTYVSPSDERLYGFTAEERLNQSFDEMLTPASMEKALETLLQELAREEAGQADPNRTISLELEYYRKDGSTIWVESIVSAMRDEKGVAIGLHGVDRDITERRRAEQILRESEERYKNFVEKSFAGVYLVQDGIFLFLNDTAAAIAGYMPQELIGRKSDSLVHPEDRATIKEKVKKMLREEELSPYEFRIVTKEGQVRWVMETVTSIQYGGRRAILGNSMDITDHKRSEADRDKAEYLYRTLAMHAQSAVFIIQEGRFRFVNRYVSAYSGYEESELMGMDPVCLVHPDDRAIARSNAVRMIKGEILAPYEFRIVSKNGDIRWILEVCTPIELDGKPAVLMNSMDFTERRYAEEMSRQSEEKFSTIFMTAPDCIAITRIEDGLITEVNLGFEEITGWGRSEAVGKTSLEIEFWVEESARDFMVEELKAGCEIMHREFLFRRKDGLVRNGIYSARPINVSGERCLVFILQDMTDRLRLEDERQKLEQQLAKAQKLEAIGTLAGGIAHDFNNLLMGIQGHASLMKIDLESSSGHHARLRHIEELVMSGSDLTNQLLGFSRGGRYAVRPTVMNDIVEKTSGMFGRTRKEIIIHKKFREDLWTVEVDWSQLEQVFMNLYVNAWHAMPGGGEILLETDNILLKENEILALPPGKYVRITVSDTGTGMDAQTRERIFEPFFTTKGMGRGTGLGLAMVYGIICGHGGFIDVMSTPGQGTTFHIYLPATEKAVVKEQATSEKEAPRGTGTVLLVDDEAMVLDVAGEMLQHLGYRIHRVGSGQEALAVYHEKKDEIDLVILDMIMPGMQGGDTFDRLREINPQVKVILSSGYSIDGQAQGIIERGCNGFIQKPFMLEQLASKVRTILDQPDPSKPSHLQTV
ncbi:MAG: PAS domain S-box protein [Syntrophaceae bacterium]|nr:PAS domain S-box protein [Syntrophaceae bacterium]